MKEPKEGEFWWAWPPDGGNPEPVEIIGVKQSGNHVLRVMGRHEPGFCKQWALSKLIRPYTPGRDR